MGIVNLKWHKACAVRGLNLTKDERAAGWPESFTLLNLAILQSPDDKSILHRALQDACAANLIPSAPAIVRKIGHEKKTYLETGSFVKRNIYGERVLDFRERIVPVMKEVEVPAVTAADFADWLAASGQPPSEHVAAWFKSQGVTEAASIAPPAGWKASTPHGTQRCDDTPAGRLVRLADVVDWLIDTKEMPCKRAVETVCTALEQGPTGWLYLLTESDYAKPMPPEHSFYIPPHVSFWEDQPQGKDGDKGLAGALKYMRSFWGESSRPGATNWHGQADIDLLAVRLSVAYRLWGYGHRVDEVQPDDAPPVVPPSEPNDLVLKKAALVNKHVHQWQTIEADLREASRNGLAEAKVKKHGYWNERIALDWAERNGKIPHASPMSSTPATFHRIWP